MRGKDSSRSGWISLEAGIRRREEQVQGGASQGTRQGGGGGGATPGSLQETQRAHDFVQEP